MDELMNEAIEEVIDEATASDLEPIEDDVCSSEEETNDGLAMALAAGAVVVSTAITGFVVGVKNSDRVKAFGGKVKGSFEEGRQKALDKRKKKKEAKAKKKAEKAAAKSKGKSEDTSDEKSKE